MITRLLPSAQKARSLAAVVLCLGSTAHARTWTEPATGHTVEADFVSSPAGFVTLRFTDGRTLKFPIHRLSADDQAFIAAQSEKPAASATAAKTDLPKRIIGTWVGYMANSDGSPHGEIQLEITETGITATNPRGNQVMGAGTYSITGRRIDATGTDGQFARKKYEGIIELDGKTLKWCSANDNPRSKRPDKMESNPQAGQFLMVLEKK